MLSGRAGSTCARNHGDPSGLPRAGRPAPEERNGPFPDPVYVMTLEGASHIGYYSRIRHSARLPIGSWASRRYVACSLYTLATIRMHGFLFQLPSFDYAR